MRRSRRAPPFNTELPSPRRIRAVHRRLRAVQGSLGPGRKLPILDELMITVLSQATSDTNRDRAFTALKERFATWEEVADAPVGEVADAIRPGGIADVKARTIQRILREIEEREGQLGLRRLGRMSDEDVTDYLVSLPGVGPKTAACVLMFSMRRPAFPIDTHIHRITRRLGWIGPKVTAAQAHTLLSPNIPPEIRYNLHVAFIHHGRTTCTARNPRCSECVLLDMCDAGPELLGSGAAR